MRNPSVLVLLGTLLLGCSPAVHVEPLPPPPHAKPLPREPPAPPAPVDPPEPPAPHERRSCEAPPAPAPLSPPCELLNDTSVALQVVEAGDATSTLPPGERRLIAPGPFHAQAVASVFAYCFPGEKITVGGAAGARFTVAKATRPDGCRVRNDTGTDLVLRLADGVKLGELRLEDSGSKEAVVAAGEITVETSGSLAAVRCASGTLRVVAEINDGIEELRFSRNDAPPQPGSLWLAWGGAHVAGHVARGSAATMGKVALAVAPDGTVSGTLPDGLELLVDAKVPERWPNYPPRAAFPVQIAQGARVTKAEASLPVSDSEPAVQSALEGVARAPIAWATPADPKRPRPTILVRPGEGWSATKRYGCFRTLRDVELVAVRTEVTLNTEFCGYYDDGSDDRRRVVRREQVASVAVYEARTGRLLATRKFPRGTPRSCPIMATFRAAEDVKTLNGAEPDPDAIAAWLGEQ